MDTQHEIRDSNSAIHEERVVQKNSMVRIAVEKASLAVLAALLIIVPFAGIASQLNLASSPLYLSTPVPPNIFFLHDDSGSMDWDMVTSENDGVMFLSAGGRTTRYNHVYERGNVYPNCGNTGVFGDLFDLLLGCTTGRVVPDEESVQATANMPSDAHGVWRAWYHGYNKMYYNPEVAYSPWAGVDSSGVNLPDARAPATETNYIAVTALRLDPFAATSSTIDITQNRAWTAFKVPTTTGSVTNISVTNHYPARYYTWTDTDNDSVVDASDAHTKIEIKATNAPFVHTSGNRTDCANPLSCTYDEEIKNYANWFMYHRRRQHASKNAFGNLVSAAASETRMGHATLNNNAPGNSSRREIMAMTGSTTTGNKKALLDALYKVQSNSGTPLRTKLDETGKYFECTTTNIFGLSANQSCPILPAGLGGTCQQNFTVLMTDGYWNDSFSGVGNTDTDGAGSYDGGSYADSYSNTLADVAMHYYERDLSATLSNQVPALSGVDNATHQHMVTYTVAFGVSGTLSTSPVSATESFTWPNPTSGDAQKIDDLRHAAYNGRGLFLTAQNPNDLNTALSSALASIGDRTGSSSAVAANSVALNTSSAIYQARFTSGEWTGDLRIVEVNIDGSIGNLIASSKSVLATQDWSTGRVILARNDSRGIPFRWTTSGANALTAALQSNLNTDPVTSATDNQGEARLEWLRGRANHEGTGNNYRERNGYKLGDIVNSDPVFVGGPSFMPETETSLHSVFRSTHLNRRKMVYVGANDGMLHGFDATSGQEKIAYVPSMVSSNLNKLTNPDYVHQYYVDGSPASGDAYDTFSNGCSSVACWRTLLVSGLGAGGKGLFALDVTDPNGDNISNLQFAESNAANIVLWEWDGMAANASAKGYSTGHLGHIYGKATVTRMQNGEWAIVFGNGYNSTSERAVLYIVRARDGVVIASFDFSGADNTSNGLSTPVVVDADGDNMADYIYAGDLRGNLWKVDVDSSSVNSWKVSHKSGANPAPLFVAVDASNVAQPITSRPTVGRHPSGLSGYMVYFGTGRYLVTGDQTPTTSPIHTFYGIWDKNTNTGNTPVSRTDLLAQTISATTVNSIDVRKVTNTTIQWRTGNSGTCQSNGSGTCLGWRNDLLTASTSARGEMMVTNPLLTGTNVLPAISFTTLIPQSDPCSAGGTGFYMLLNPVNGGPLAQAVIDITGDGIIDSDDLVDGEVPAGYNPNIGIPSDPIAIQGRGGIGVVPISGSGGGIVNVRNYFPYGELGRQSWRQLK
jgi:type IV pilus assembly protein PilY1